ncbi:MAG: DNA replication/repair protein RecF [Christensenellales bacterium]
MKITHLQMEQFRSYPYVDMRLEEGITVLYGANAQGKTNLLEGVFLCSAGKSHRAVQDREMIREDAEQAHLRAQILRTDAEHTLDIHLARAGGKRISVDGARLRRLADFVGHLKCVLFSPENIRMIDQGPVMRRQYMDLALCQTDRRYVACLVDYNRALKQRNALLRAGAPAPLHDILSVWDEQLASCGGRIMQLRESFLKQVAPVAANIYGTIAQENEQMQILYRPGAAGADGDHRERILMALSQSRREDMARRLTTAGPHRDDFFITIDGREARRYASQGQRRTAALALKLSELYWMQDTAGERPVLLLDDVFSELDIRRRERLMHAVSDGQTLITCTEAETLPIDRGRIAAMYRVSGGRLRRET